MSTVLTNALLDANTGGLYRRHDVQVMDTSSTSLPAASATLPTVDGVVLQVGDKVLFTALTEGANAVYTLRFDFISGQASYSFPLTTDAHYTSDARGTFGAPELHDILLVTEGTNAGKLMIWDGSAWDATNVADTSEPSTATLAGDVTGTASATHVALVGASTAANIHSAELAANAATDTQTASTIMKRDSLGATSVACKSGATGSRPVVTTVGYMFFDTTLGLPIWWKGAVWVNGAGATV